MNPYSSVKLEGARWPVILSEAKNLPVQREILPLHSHSGLKASCTQNDSQQGARKLDRGLQFHKLPGLFHADVPCLLQVFTRIALEGHQRIGFGDCGQMYQARGNDLGEVFIAL